MADFVLFRRVNAAWMKEPRFYWIITVIETKGFYAPGAKRKLKLFREKYPNITLRVE
jgi:hypothetical protein